MVLSSIGYRSEPLEGAPFDARLGILANRRAHLQREYVMGQVGVGAIQAVCGCLMLFGAVCGRAGVLEGIVDIQDDKAGCPWIAQQVLAAADASADL